MFEEFRRLLCRFKVGHTARFLLLLWFRDANEMQACRTTRIHKLRMDGCPCNGFLLCPYLSSMSPSHDGNIYMRLYIKLLRAGYLRVMNKQQPARHAGARVVITKVTGHD